MDRAVIERIAKLLELAKSPCNEHEAALAAERAKELLAANNLSIGEVELAAAPSAETHYLCPRHPPRYLWVLVKCAELLFDCASILAREDLFGPTCIALCGVPQNVEAAALILRYLEDSIRAMARSRQDLLTLKRRNSRRANLKRRMSYFYGAACKVLVEVEKARAKGDADAKLQAIIHVSNAIALRHLNAKYPRQKKIRQPKLAIDERAFRLGVSDGARIQPYGVHKSLPARPEDR